MAVFYLSKFIQKRGKRKKGEMIAGVLIRGGFYLWEGRSYLLPVEQLRLATSL